MSSNVIDMEDFRISTKATENWEEKMEAADAFLEHIGEKTNHDVSTLFFLWSNVLDVLVENEYTPEDLHGMVTRAWANRVL